MVAGDVERQSEDALLKLPNPHRSVDLEISCPTTSYLRRRLCSEQCDHSGGTVPQRSQGFFHGSDRYRGAPRSATKTVEASIKKEETLAPLEALNICHEVARDGRSR